MSPANCMMSIVFPNGDNVITSAYEISPTAKDVRIAPAFTNAVSVNGFLF